MVDTPGKITLWQIEIFVASAEERSITAAARRLGASASAVSQQLTNLETSLGTPLLNRGERPMPLTPAGEAFLQRAQTILNEAAEAVSELTLQDMAARVRLRLGVVEDFDADVTPSLLMSLSETMPRAQFLLETGASHRLLDQLEARGLDVAIAAEPNDLSGIWDVLPLLHEPFVVVAPKRAVRDEAKIIETLRQMPLIQYTSRHVMGRQISAHLARTRLPLSHRFELDSYHAIMAMVAKGEGWSILTPLGVLRAKRFLDRVETFPLPFEPLSRTISLVARKDSVADMPERIAETVRPLIQSEIVDFCLHKMPWLKGQMEVLN
ncbi:LysR family transcriptional regulator [Litoreibacter roseus]|uniref:LysR family transcriptional regulator n=1 Tax=Litoreibacter roseus TaxID=2601869 RepID=A0A6N6JKE9_9RHOB|nr:LysR family transcriptional regulator [Litoreibacter roseus]GFE65909.1 LysR family transcriptional regulator [Litoreibacter roseus]